MKNCTVFVLAKISIEAENQEELENVCQEMEYDFSYKDQDNTERVVSTNIEEFTDVHGDDIEQVNYFKD